MTRKYTCYFLGIHLAHTTVSTTHEPVEHHQPVACSMYGAVNGYPTAGDVVDALSNNNTVSNNNSNNHNNTVYEDEEDDCFLIDLLDATDNQYKLVQGFPGDTAGVNGDENYVSNEDFLGDEYDEIQANPEFISRISHSEDKAGLDQCDKEKVNQVIYQSTKGSRYFNKSLKDDARTKQRIDRMLKQYETLKKEDFVEYEREADKLIEKMESERDLSRSWLHVDMDAFYASVEIRDDPKLGGIPMAVGSLSMLCTSSYEARKYGVRSAMPGFIAMKLCPELTIVPLNMEKYKEASYHTRMIFARYDPNFEAYSLDEASLDVTEYLATHTGVTAEDVAIEIRKDMRGETKLTCSIGVACNRRLAKICSNINKPDGHFVVPSTREDVVNFMENLAIRKAAGIGKVTEKLLNALNITKCGELYAQRAILHHLFQGISAEFFFRIALGLGSAVHNPSRPNKSVSIERTFTHTADSTAQYEICHDLCLSLASALNKKQLEGKTITLKLKTANFEIKNRSFTLIKYISDGEDIYTHARKLLTDEMPIDIRLMGVRMSGFKEPHQASNGKQAQIDGYFIKATKAANTATDSSTSTPSSFNKSTLADHLRKATDSTDSDRIEVQKQPILCPICGKTLTDASNNFLVNVHLDNCLQAQNTKPATPTKRSAGDKKKTGKKVKA